MTTCRRTIHRRRIAGGRQRSRSTEQCRKVKTFYCGAAVSVVQFSSFLNFQDDETKSLCLKLCSSRGCCLSSVVWPQLTQRHILSYLNVYLSSLHTGHHSLDTSQLNLSFIESVICDASDAMTRAGSKLPPPVSWSSQTISLP